MMFKFQDTSTGMLSPSMQNIPCSIHFLLTADNEKIEFFFDGWRGEDILSVVEWTETNEFVWALHLDLALLGSHRREAILPFPWADDSVPGVAEALYAWRAYVNEEL